MRRNRQKKKTRLIFSFSNGGGLGHCTGGVHDRLALPILELLTLSSPLHLAVADLERVRAERMPVGREHAHGTAKFCPILEGSVSAWRGVNTGSNLQKLKVSAVSKPICSRKDWYYCQACGCADG